MIELYIDNQQAVLPSGFSLEIINENPFFTKNGNYTYDLTLSLENAINTRIYKNYNRKNNSENIVSERSARLIVDNKVLINGSEVILEITDKEVKVQLVSGESELNYFLQYVRVDELTDDKYFKYQKLADTIVDRAQHQIQPRKFNFHSASLTVYAKTNGLANDISTTVNCHYAWIPITD